MCSRPTNGAIAVPVTTSVRLGEDIPTSDGDRPIVGFRWGFKLIQIFQSPLREETQFHQVRPLPSVEVL